MRIYPAYLPVIPDEPSPEAFRVIDVDEDRGQGIVVLREFRTNDVLFRMNGRESREMTLHSLQVGPDLHVDDPWFAGKTLHSCDPNARLDIETRLFVALRSILPGDLLTMDYDATEDILYRPFSCRCGATNCRGYVAGRAVATPSFGADDLLGACPV